MAAEGNKNLEIGVVVNEGQMSKFNRAIQDATREVNKLAEALNRASNTFKGFLSGANVSGGGGGMTFRPGSGFAKSPMMASAGVGQPAVAVASTIKAVTKESTDSLRVMDQTVRTVSSKMASSLDPLDRALANIEKRFKNIKSVGGGGVMLPGVGGGQGASAAPFGIENRGGIDYAKAQPTTLERMTNRLFQPIFGGGGAKSAGGSDQSAGGLLRGAANMLGIPPWMIGGAAAAAVPLGIYNMVQGGTVSRDSFVAKEVLDAQGDFLRRGAMVQQSFGNYSMDLRRNALTQYAYGKLTPNDLHAMFSDETFQARLQQAWTKAGGSGSIGDVKNDWTDRMKVALGMQSGPLQNDNTELHQKMDRAINDVLPEMKAAAVERAKLREANLSPEERTYIPEYQAEVGARMGMARQAGRAMRKVRQPDGTIIYEDFGKTAGLGSAYTGEEITGQMARIGSIAGRGMMSEGFAKETLALQYGGYGNAVDIANIGNQYGNASLMNQVNRSMGSGGVDVTAGSQMANIVAAAMQQGNYSIGGGSAAQGIMSAFSTGTTGGDMRMARIAGAGVRAYDAMLSGSTDNLQKAINVLSANQAAPGTSIQAKHALEGIGSVQLMQIMRDISQGKELPIQLRDFGITAKMVTDYVSTQNRFAYSRFITGTGMPNAVETAVSGARAAGGAGNYINQLLSGRTFKNQRERINFIQEQARLLGEGLHATGEAATNEAGQGRVLMELGQSAALFPNLNGGGAYDAGASSQAAQAKKNADAAQLAKEEWLAKHPEATTPANIGTIDAADALSQAAGDVNGSVKQLQKAMQGFVDEVKAATIQLRDARKGGGNEKAGGKG